MDGDLGLAASASSSSRLGLDSVELKCLACCCCCCAALLLAGTEAGAARVEADETDSSLPVLTCSWWCCTVGVAPWDAEAAAAAAWPCTSWWRRSFEEHWLCKIREGVEGGGQGNPEK